MNLCITWSDQDKSRTGQLRGLQFVPNVVQLIYPYAKHTFSALQILAYLCRLLLTIISSNHDRPELEL